MQEESHLPTHNVRSSPYSQDLHEYYKSFTKKGSDELEELSDLVKEMMEAEYARAETMDKLSQFDLFHLKESPFEEAVQGILRKADNEASIVYEFVENLKNDVYDPLIEFKESYRERNDDALTEVREQIKALGKVNDKLEKEKKLYSI